MALRHRGVDIVLGFDTPEEYLTQVSGEGLIYFLFLVSTISTHQDPYFGCIVGRCANRIKQGCFSLGDHEYKLAQNNG